MGEFSELDIERQNADRDASPWWAGMSAEAERQLAAHPELTGMRFSEWYEVELIDRAEAALGRVPFVVQEDEDGHRFEIQPANGGEPWAVMVGERNIVFMAPDLPDAESFDAVLGRLVTGLASA